MAGVQRRCCNVSMANVLQHTCLFTVRPRMQYRLKHHRTLVARQRCKVVTSAFSSAWGECESDASNTHSRRPNVHSSKQGPAECNSSTTKGSLVDRILLALRQIGLSALAVLFGLSTAMSAHARYIVFTSVTKHCTHSNPKECFMTMSVIVCSIPLPPDPVATTMQQESVRHGETVFAEAGVSQAADARWCQDTGIQLAAAVSDTPGSAVRPTDNLLVSYNVCQPLYASHLLCMV